MGRSRKLTLTDWTAANNALMQYFEGKKSKLAGHVRISRTIVTNFFNEKSVGESSFRKICLALRLNWQDISSVDLPSDSSSEQPSVLTESGEDLLEHIKERCRQKILDQHSRMRLLSGEEVGVDQLYVDVWLLNKPESKHFNTSENLLSSFDISKDRLALGKRIQQNPGFEIANSNPRLIILGKPGSGKTTFLKHLAVDWCKGKFQPEKICILIELRRIRGQSWNLVSAIGQELKSKEEEVLGLLNQGKILILMDGLDEVPVNEVRRKMQAQIKQFSEDYSSGNRFILTCRTQIMETIPRGFASVEVADFSPEQVRWFVLNWFTANGQSETEASKQWEKIYRAIINQPDLKELTATPVLLSLMCLVLQDQREIPTNRYWLYSKGIKLLLSRWNNEKEIEEWEFGTKAYRQLRLEDKEALLLEIAAHKFENPNNFVLFKQDELVKQIDRKLNLANLKEGIAVLKAFEAQHGLLIERADELWSFSHLTFQEHFTVQWLTQLAPQKLAQKIADQQWQLVVQQLAKSQQPADQLLRSIKQAIDQSIAQETIIQDFLDWLLRKSESVQASSKFAAIRAFYFSLSIALDLTQNLDNHGIVDTHDAARDRTLILNLRFAFEIELALAFSAYRARALNINLIKDLNLDLDCARARARELDLDHTLLTVDLAFVVALDRVLILDQVLDRDHGNVHDFGRELGRID
ncbi:MAG: NACHT domain-containing protein, partial [Cyanobacteria bacterium]|nr:NACHT domain-containing protein [Cyanobacteriota bacterium]